MTNESLSEHVVPALVEEAASDVEAICQAARDIIAGQTEADRGGGLFKKRMARSKEGKSGGHRLLVGYKAPNAERIIFLYAFAKSQRANISKKEKEALILVCHSFFAATDDQIGELLGLGKLREVKCNERTS
ncbi:MAG: type II toxin-antitoxin system RelE/ParE family toxin [Desulfovibrionaceae bacterium]